MTTAKSRQKFRLPDPPEHPEDKMTNFDHLSLNGSAYLLSKHLGNTETTLFASERYLVVRPTRSLPGSRYPDLLIAFDADPVAYKESNGYIIDEQGKPPDFVLEIASRRTGREDVTNKRNDYAALGIPEYWRFDETGEFHRARLAGDRLAAGGQYQSIPIEEVAEGVLQGYSPVLNLHIRWENGQLRWHDPETGQHIPTFDGEREARMRAQDEIREEREVLRREREARLLAEARVRELEERLESHGNQ
jgi:Uma2 family endonuclease